MSKKEYDVTYAKIKYFGPSTFNGRPVLIVDWGVVGIGLGELAFYQEGDNFVCDSETLGKDFAMAVLKKALDNIKYI